MKKFSAIWLSIATICGLASVSTQVPSAQGIPSPTESSSSANAVKEQVYSPNAFKVPFLGVDGTFNIDTTEISASDPRNPKRVVFNKMEFFSFYDDLTGEKPIAKNCRYVYKGAAGDPFYYPKQSKTSIWDLFELVSGEDACNKFYYVILRSPHGEPVHFHMRYGDINSSFKTLLQLSNLGPEDKTNIDPWWSVYCAEGVSGCD
ncbi:hypothetical protein [Scytonema sp. NUACC26]|uniref:hypothetical protein n=1 Tax=Scytonema sp. NUACC26 TaxID=3140176 RepID=UPI0038B22F09